jgi:hypothetical protein
MTRMPIPLSTTERRERVALPINDAKSNYVLGTELGVNEATVRRDRTFLATPLKDRPVKKVKKVKPVRELSLDKVHDRRLKELLEVGQGWIYEQTAVLSNVEYILDKAGRLLNRDRFIVENLPVSLRTPSELLAWARPKVTVEDNAARVDYIANWFARWLALCLPREDELQDEVLREISIWARSPPYRFVY